MFLAIGGSLSVYHGCTYQPVWFIETDFRLRQKSLLFSFEKTTENYKLVEAWILLSWRLVSASSEVERLPRTLELRRRCFFLVS